MKRQETATQKMNRKEKGYIGCEQTGNEYTGDKETGNGTHTGQKQTLFTVRDVNLGDGNIEGQTHTAMKIPFMYCIPFL